MSTLVFIGLFFGLIFSYFCFFRKAHSSAFFLLIKNGAVFRPVAAPEDSGSILTLAIIEKYQFELTLVLRKYQDGVGIARKGDSMEFFLPEDHIRTTGDWIYPMEFCGPNKPVRINFGVDIFKP